MLSTFLPSVTHVDHLVTTLVASCQHSLVGRTDEVLVGTMRA
jgi:hypothetical protein